MGLLIILAGIFWVIHWDAALLQKEHPVLYKKILEYEPTQWVVFFILLAPIYLTRRHKFLKELRFPLGQEAAMTGKDFYRKVEASGAVIVWGVISAFSVLMYKVLSDTYRFPWSELEEISVFSVFILLLMIGIIIGSRPYGWRERADLKAIFCLSGGSWLKWRLIGVPFLIGVLLAFIAAVLLVSRSVTPQTPLGEVLQETQSPGALWIFILIAVLLAPLLEEMIFRGYFFTALREFHGAWFSIFVVAGIFTFLHIGQYWGDWLAIVIVGILGVVLTVLRERTGSTIPSIVLHYTYNLGMVFIPVILIFSQIPADYLQYQTAYQQMDGNAKEELLKKVISARPDFPEAYNDLAWLYAEEARNLEEALLLIESALKFRPQNEAFLDTKAEIFYRLQRFDEAIAIEENLVNRFPESKIFRRQLQKFRSGIPTAPTAP